jgi:hypothetical protein
VYIYHGTIMYIMVYLYWDFPASHGFSTQYLSHQSQVPQCGATASGWHSREPPDSRYHWCFSLSGLHQKWFSKMAKHMGQKHVKHIGNIVWVYWHIYTYIILYRLYII